MLEELRRIGSALNHADSESRRREMHGPVVLKAQSVMVMLPGSAVPAPPAATPEPELCPPHRWVVTQIGRRHCGRCMLPQRLVWRDSKRAWEFDMLVVADYPTTPAERKPRRKPAT